MATKRVNFTLPEKVVGELSSRVPKGQRSAFVASAVEEKIRTLEAEELRAELIEGYQARAEEGAEINREWEPATLEVPW
ncbi:MAG: hypothetical protein WAP23_03085 [Candidatus Spechtbacterales bacterium]